MCGDGVYPRYVLGTLGMRSGCLRLCVGLSKACVRGWCFPSLCVRCPRHEVGVFEIVCGVVGGLCVGMVFTLVMCSDPSARGRSE